MMKYNPNNDRGITTQANVSDLRCFDGEDCVSGGVFCHGRGLVVPACLNMAVTCFS